MEESNSVESVQAALMAHAHQCAVNQENKTIRSYTTLHGEEQQKDRLPKPPMDPTHSYGIELGVSSPREWLVPIRIDVTALGYRYKDVFLWNLFEEHMSPLDFADQLCADLELPSAMVQPIAHHMADQLLRHYREFRSASKEYTNAKSLKEKHPDGALISSVPWARFSSSEEPQVILDSLVNSFRRDNRDFLQSLGLRVRLSEKEYSDQFFLDLGNTVGTRSQNNPITLVEKTCYELGLPLHYIPVLCAALFGQIHSRVFSALRSELSDVADDLKLLKSRGCCLRKVPDNGPVLASLQNHQSKQIPTSTLNSFNEANGSRSHRYELLALEHLKSQLGASGLPLNEAGLSNQYYKGNSGAAATDASRGLTLPVCVDKESSEEDYNSGHRVVLTRYNEDRKKKRKTSSKEGRMRSEEGDSTLLIISPQELIPLNDFPNRLRYHQLAIDGALIARMRFAYMLGSDQALTAAGGGYGVGNVLSLKKYADKSSSEYQQIVGEKRQRSNATDLSQEVQKCWVHYRSSELSHAQKIILHSVRSTAGNCAAELIACRAPYAIMGAGAVPASLVRAIKLNKQIPLNALPKGTVEKGFGIPLPGGRVVTSQGFYERRKSSKSVRRIKRLFRKRLRKQEGTKSSKKHSASRVGQSRVLPSSSSAVTNGANAHGSGFADSRSESKATPTQESTDEGSEDGSDSDISWFYSDENTDVSSTDSEEETEEDHLLLTPPTANNLLYSNLNSAYLSIAALCHSVGADLKLLGVEPQAVARLAIRQARGGGQNKGVSSSSTPTGTTPFQRDSEHQNESKEDDEDEREQEETSSSGSSSGDEDTEEESPSDSRVSLPPKLEDTDNVFAVAREEVRAIYNEMNHTQSSVPNLGYENNGATTTSEGKTVLANGTVFTPTWGTEGNINAYSIFTRDMYEQMPKDVLQSEDLSRLLKESWNKLSSLQVWAYKERARYMNTKGAYIVVPPTTESLPLEVGGYLLFIAWYRAHRRNDQTAHVQARRTWKECSHASKQKWIRLFKQLCESATKKSSG
eukprot:gb/GECG01011445.1/.p1 GENE.gb/GECG01011445.1/~~gb/GECG01011445.1/.p1  ORF type:complete len:1031 (+),score=135.83 gb/GECG01011445.1/:1-3093(+)